jgi:hypothetical protein
MIGRRMTSWHRTPVSVPRTLQGMGSERYSWDNGDPIGNVGRQTEPKSMAALTAPAADPTQLH